MKFRSDEQAAIARFLAERGATKLPSAIEMSKIDGPEPLKWDRTKRKFTRAPVKPENEASYNKR